MPATTIRIKRDSGESRLMFITDQVDNTLTINVYPCDENYIPKGKPITSTIVGRNEEDYHRNLRKDASEKDQLMKGYCTNPEWNPGYVESNFDSESNPDYIEPDSNLSC